MFEDCNDWALDLYPKTKPEEISGDINNDITYTMPTTGTYEINNCIKGLRAWIPEAVMKTTATPTEGDTKVETYTLYSALYRSLTDPNRIFVSDKRYKNSAEALQYFNKERFVRLLTDAPEISIKVTKTYKLQWVEVEE